MNKSLIAVLIVAVLVGLLCVVLFGMYASYNNTEVALRKQVEAKQKDNENVFDNFWKKLQEVGGIPDRERATAKAMFVEYAAARTSKDEGHMMAWVQENIPKADPALYQNLMNTISSSRDDWRANQTRLLDMNRERNTLIEQIPARWFISNTTPISVVIVTSARTEAAFSSGKDEATFKLP